MRDKVTVPALQARKGGPKIKMVTAYDAPSARIADRAGADIILVGDTLAHVVLGFDDTLPATVDIMIHHTAAVARAKPGALALGRIAMDRYSCFTTCWVFTMAGFLNSFASTLTWLM